MHAPFPVTLTTHSKLTETDFENLSFADVFTDHLLEAEYINGVWTNVAIKPYQPISFFPSMAALHYGQAIFEGIKAYRHTSGDAYIFRPHENMERFNLSAERMCMPSVPEEIFIGGMRQLLQVDHQWIPFFENSSLYIRPFMFATETTLGVKVSSSYKFMIILCPSGAYYTKPVKICVEEKYTRAAPGGVGMAKNAGNYGGSLKAPEEAKAKGYDQVLWTDAFEHKWLQEVGTMNVFFVIDGVVITPSLEEGTILNGVTRKSAITVLSDAGYTVEERRISIDEVVESYQKGIFTEIFGTGTAVTVSHIKELAYRDVAMTFGEVLGPVASLLKSTLSNIRYGLVPDNHNWLVKVEG